MNDESGFFRAVARSLGVSINLNAKAHSLRDKIEEVLLSVAQALLPDGDIRSIEALVLYAQSSAKYLAGIDTAIERARFIAGREQRSKVAFADIKRAIRESVIPSDSAFAEAMQSVNGPNRKRAVRVSATPLQPDFNSPALPPARFEVERPRACPTLWRLQADEFWQAWTESIPVQLRVWQTPVGGQKQPPVPGALPFIR